MAYVQQIVDPERKFRIDTHAEEYQHTETRHRVIVTVSEITDSDFGISSMPITRIETTGNYASIDQAAQALARTIIRDEFNGLVDKPADES